MKRRTQLFIARKIRRWLDLLESSSEQRRFDQFSNSPNNFVMDKPYRLIGAEFMEIGDDVYLGPNAMLNCMVEYPSEVMCPPDDVARIKYEPKIVIGNKVSATGGLQLAACVEIVIEDEVLMATNVHMTDNFHGYQGTDIAYKFQPLWREGPIRVGRGCWLGQNVVVTPNTTIGEMCIVGANSVVTTDLPAYSIAVGAPARVTRRWCDRENKWISA